MLKEQRKLKKIMPEWHGKNWEIGIQRKNWNDVYVK